eukprot:1157689-Pelagomonas_calceolata.AAC.5
MQSWDAGRHIGTGSLEKHHPGLAGKAQHGLAMISPNLACPHNGTIACGASSMQVQPTNPAHLAKEARTSARAGHPLHWDRGAWAQPVPWTLLWYGHLGHCCA